MSYGDEYDPQKMQETVAGAERFLADNLGTSESMPMRPEEPLPQDCCGLGCATCVFDIYRADTYLWARDCLIQAGLVEECPGVSKKKKTEDVVLSPIEYRSFKLLSIEKITEDSNIYRFELPENTVLGLPIGSHLVLR